MDLMKYMESWLLSIHFKFDQKQKDDVCGEICLPIVFISYLTTSAFGRVGRRRGFEV